MRRVLVPVADSTTLQRTVAYAVESAINEDDAVVIRAVYLPQLRPEADRQPAAEPTGQALLDAVETWVDEAAIGATAAVTVETAVIEGSTAVYTPLDAARLLGEEVDRHAIDWVVLDPGYGPRAETGFLDPVERLLREETAASVTVAPYRRRDGILPGALDLPRGTFIFSLSLAFYLLLAGGVSPYAVVTGVITAALVTLTIGTVTLWFPPDVRHTSLRFVRAVVYVPYLFLSILRANIAVSRVILHPDMPIDPAVVRYHPAVYGPFPLTTLGNSITLTPGTLSMRIDEGDLLVHTLTADARTDLADGGLERAVRFLFFGRTAMRMPSPAERGDFDLVEGDEG